MRFIDKDNDRELNLIDLYNHFQEMKSGTDTGFPNNFPVFLFVLIMDTLNGRNNLHIIGLTGEEVYNIVNKLKGRFLK